MPEATSLQPGQKVGGGRFTLVKPLGRGGMGEVWLAQDERLNEQAALKFLPPEIRADAVALDDLRRETRKSRQLSHANIVRIHDIFEAQGEPPFLAMEYVDGPTLSALSLQQPQRCLPWDYLRPLVLQLCAALDYAHDQKVIHRDLKPSNLMLDSQGRLKLADFGIAATVSDSMSRISVQSVTSGTLAYMSPQQTNGERPSVGDDIYALGATLYDLLTSRPPFYRGNILHQVQNIAPKPLAERLAELEVQNPVPEHVSALVLACLEKEPGRRPPTVQAVAEWVVSEDASSDSEVAAEPAPGPAGTKSRLGLWLGLAAAGTLALLCGFWFLFLAKSKPSGAAVESAGLSARPSVPFAGNLSGTTWKLKDSDGETCWFQFGPNGLLTYQAARGIRSNGKWQVDGAGVSIDINDGFAVLSGTLSGKKMSGKALSKNGQTWTWEATPKD